jgi:hypothetical protein
VSLPNNRTRQPSIYSRTAEFDHLTPPAIGRSPATFYGADYHYLRGRAHNVLLEPNAADLVQETYLRALNANERRPILSHPKVYLMPNLGE